MSYQITFYIGLDKTHTLDRASVRDSALYRLSHEFDGATYQDTQGAWVSPSSGLIIEPGCTYTVIVEASPDRFHLRDIAYDLGRSYRQESVLYTVLKLEESEFVYA